MSTTIKQVFNDSFKLYKLVIITERKEVIVSEHWSMAGAKTELLKYMSQQQLELVA